MPHGRHRARCRHDNRRRTSALLARLHGRSRPHHCRPCWTVLQLRRPRLRRSNHLRSRTGERYRSAVGSSAPLSLRDVIAAAEHGNASAIEILREAGRALGIAAASLAHIFFPDRIAIAGGLSAAGDLIMQPLDSTFQQVASDHARSQTKISRAFLGPHATLIGAGCPFWKNVR